MLMVNSGSLPASKMKFFVMIVNSITKSPMLDVPGVSGYINSYNLLLVTVQMYFPDVRKFLTWELFLLFLIRKKAHDAGKTNKRWA